MIMKRTRFTTIFLIIFSLFSFLFILNYEEERVFAQTSCPSYIDPDPYSQKCLDYMHEQLDKIEKEKGAVQKRLKDEEYQQLTLSEQISYINAQISQTETNIKSLEVEIAALDIEITMLEETISEMEDNISILGQETSILENSVNKRITESYKYSFVGALELFLDVRNLSTVIRKTKYISMTRTQDRMYLREYSAKMTTIKEEEKILGEKKSEVQIKRNSLDDNKIELANERKRLGSSKTEQSRLLAESKKREVALQTELATLTKEANEVTGVIQTIILNKFRSGLIPVDREVNAGDIIGYQGHTGFSYGSHLHFNLSGAGNGPLELGYFSIVNGRIYGNNAIAPLGDGSILTYGYHQGYSLDMIGSYSSDSLKYTVGSGEVCCPSSIFSSYDRQRLCDVNFLSQGKCCVRPGQYNLNGEGTPVRAIKAGFVTRVETDVCGGKYVVIDHGGGEATLYLHLR
jgi:peptidoglycan hydrolase CwlO-like protein